MEHRRKQGTWQRVQFRFRSLAVMAGWGQMGEKMAADLVRMKRS